MAAARGVRLRAAAIWLLVALVAGTAVSAWQAVMANRARLDAVMALAEVDAQRREARRANAATARS